MVSKCQLSVLLPEGKRALKRQLYNWRNFDLVLVVIQSSAFCCCLLCSSFVLRCWSSLPSILCLSWQCDSVTYHELLQGMVTFVFYSLWPYLPVFRPLLVVSVVICSTKWRTGSDKQSLSSLIRDIKSNASWAWTSAIHSSGTDAWGFCDSVYHQYFIFACKLCSNQPRKLTNMSVYCTASKRFGSG